MDKTKLRKHLLWAVPAALALLVGIFLLANRNHHTFTVYADGDYISQTLVDQFTEETGIKVHLVTGDRTPQANADAFREEDSDSSAEVLLQEQTPMTLPELLQQSRNEAIEQAREKAEKQGDGSSFDPEGVEYPASEYDVVLTDGATLGTLRERGLIQPLTYSKVTNLKNITPEYRTLSYDPDGAYTVTTMWEYVGLLVNTELVNEQITSWEALWDAKYAGKIVMPGQLRDALAVTLLAMGENPASDDSLRLNAALNRLEEQRPLVVSYSGRDAYLLLQNNQAALYPCWSGDALAMMRENPALVFLLPPGGTYRTAFGYALCADSACSEEAHAFINFMCKTESLAKNAVYSKYASTSEGAIDKLDESWSDNPVIYPEARILASTPLLNPLPLDVEQHCALRWKAISAPAEAEDNADSSAAGSAPAQEPEATAANASAQAGEQTTDAAAGSAPAK